MSEVESRIVKMFTEQTGDLLDKDDFESLQMCIYVAAKFCDYLQGVQHLEFPTDEDDSTSYIIGTVKSGLEDMFSVASLNRILTGRVRSILCLEDISAFPAFKQRYEEAFDVLQQESTTLQGRFQSLVDLGKMQLLFVALTLT
jgi:hypothetical protein